MGFLPFGFWPGGERFSQTRGDHFMMASTDFEPPSRIGACRQPFSPGPGNERSGCLAKCRCPMRCNSCLVPGYPAGSTSWSLIPSLASLHLVSGHYPSAGFRPPFLFALFLLLVLSSSWTWLSQAAAARHCIKTWRRTLMPNAIKRSVRFLQIKPFVLPCSALKGRPGNKQNPTTTTTRP